MQSRCQCKFLIPFIIESVHFVLMNARVVGLRIYKVAEVFVCFFEYYEMRARSEYGYNVYYNFALFYKNIGYKN